MRRSYWNSEPRPPVNVEEHTFYEVGCISPRATLMPPAVNQSNVKHYRHTNSVTDYKEFPGRSHYTVGQDGWEEVADYALKWAEEKATQPAA